MSITHKECGGELVVDYSHPPFYDKEEQETYYPVKCSQCGAALGFLSEVETKCLVH